MVKNIFKCGILLQYLLLGVLFQGLAQPANNRKSPVFEGNRFSIGAGGYLANVSSNFRMGADELGLGLDINFEEALGLESTALTYYGMFQYCFSKNRRSAVSARYFEIARSASKVLGSDIHIRDTVFNVGTELETVFSLKVINTDYSYAFLMNDRVRISGTFGLFIMPMKFSFRAGGRKETASQFVAPLPVIGLESYFLLSRKFALKQGLHIFYLKIGELQGKMSELMIELEYRPIPRLAIGLGYNSIEVDVKQGKNSNKIFGNLVGSVGYRQTGVLLSAGFDF